MLKRMLTLVMVLALGLGLASSALASGVTVNGSMRTELTYAWFSQETGNVDKFHLEIFNTSSSRLKFTYLSDDKKFKGYAEIQVRSRTQGLNVSTRHAYVEYNWGGGLVRIGQENSLPPAYGDSQMLWGGNGMTGYGYFWFSRTEAIRIMIGDKYKLKFAASSPMKTGTFPGSNWHYLPAFETALDMSFGNVNIYPYLRWEWPHGTDAAGTEYDYHSLDFGMHINGDFGLVGFTVGAHYGINSATAVNNGAAGGLPVYDFVTGDRANHKQYGGYGELRVGGLYMGVGYQAGDRSGKGSVAGYTQKAWSMGAYANYWIPFGKMTFVPEVVWYHEGETDAGVKLGHSVRVGVFMMMNF